jgi:hypothetical protein
MNSSITVVAQFKDGNWINILKKDKGQDFEIVGNYGYLIITSKDTTVTLNGPKSMLTDIKWSEYLGWNLFDNTVFSNSNASALVTGFKSANINTVAYWDSTLGRFEYYSKDKLESGIYGKDFSTKDIDSIFLRIY